MRSGEQMLESSMSSSTSMPPGRSGSAGWNKTPNSAKTRRAAFIRRPVRRRETQKEGEAEIYMC